jgi:hypothetical protein
VLKLLIERGCHVSWCSRYVASMSLALHAVQVVSFVLFILLFRRSGETPLHRAAIRGHTECVQILLQHGAVIDAKY